MRNQAWVSSRTLARTLKRLIREGGKGMEAARCGYYCAPLHPDRRVLRRVERLPATLGVHEVIKRNVLGAHRVLSFVQ